MIMYPYSVHILRTERHNLLPSVPPHGHGIVLLGFWSLLFIEQNLRIMNAFNWEWWFELKT